MVTLNLFLFKRGYKLSFLNTKHNPKKFSDVPSRVSSGIKCRPYSNAVPTNVCCCKPQGKQIQLKLDLAGSL